MDTAMPGQLDHLPWTTQHSHPWSETEYQEAEYDHGTWARVVADGHEVVSPQRNTSEILRQYQARVRRAIESGEQDEAPGNEATAAPRGSSRPTWEYGAPDLATDRRREADSAC